MLWPIKILIKILLIISKSYRGPKNQNPIEKYYQKSIYMVDPIKKYYAMPIKNPKILWSAYQKYYGLVHQK